jgi:hypothetical protein
MFAIAAIACCLSPAVAQTRILEAQIPGAQVEGQVSEQVPPQAESGKPAPAVPAEAAPPDQGPRPGTVAARFSFNRVDDGVLRLDTQTGQVAFCSARGAGWACHAVPEDRAAFEQEIARLQDQVTALKSEIAALREPPPPRPPADLVPPPPADKSNELTIKLPTQEDIDRASAALQQAWRRLVDMLVNFKNDMMRKG